MLGSVLSQNIVDPTSSPVLNNGGWVYNAAVLLGVLGAVMVLLVLFGYMRFAPRFQTDEGQRKPVRAPRVQPGQDVRRPVNVTGTPMVVQPPLVAVATSAAVAASPAPAPAPAAAPTPAPAPAPTPEPAPAPAAAAEAPAPAAPGAAAADEPGGDVSSVAAAPAPAPAAAERKEVALDQETFDRVLAELLEKGSERRVAEGQARRAAMIAARKKAES